MRNNLKLAVLGDEFTIHRFHPEQKITTQIFKSEFFSITRTDNELSVVCDAKISLPSEKNETGWSCIKVLGPLDFSLTGISAEISKVLAEAKISIFALSTYDTDYILVKTETLNSAQDALRKTEYIFP